MSEHHDAPTGFWRKYIFSVDHKVIGIQYIIMAAVMALLGSSLAMVMRIQLAWRYQAALDGNFFPVRFLTGCCCRNNISRSSRCTAR